MRIVCLGGGPAGLYFSILMKQANLAHDVSVYERSKPDDTFGWGIVFSDATLDNLARADPQTHAAITRNFHHWNDCHIHFKGRRITSGGHGFCGISRKKLNGILQTRATKLGVSQIFETNIDDIPFSTADLIVIADGAHSRIRDKHAAHFKPAIDVGKCRYLWFGSTLKLNAFTFISEETEWGWFQAHAYPFDAGASTFIVECREETWLAAGLDKLDPAASAAFCERLFAGHLQGSTLMVKPGHPRGSAWLNFHRVFCEKWHYRNAVLIGDAAHTAHFSIGSGTKLAMEDAIALSRAINACGEHDITEALEAYQTERSQEVLRLQSAAHNRMEWFENVARYAHLAPEQFAYSLLTSSQRISHENLRLRDADYVDSIETWLAAQSGIEKPPRQPLPPMFTPFRIGGLTLKNRIVVSPMAMYSCTDGMPNDFHLVHLGSRALGGAGLVMTEMTAISAEARITPGCAGLWNLAQMTAWQRIVDFVHQSSAAKIGLQIGHAGPKGSTQLGWEASNEPLAEDNWPLIAASAVSYIEHGQIPQAMTRSDMDEVLEQFVAVTKHAALAGFDLLELHCAHGYLLSGFLCPLTNRRNDDYGGSLENRLRYPLEVCRAVRAAWPAQHPLSVRISAHDWAPGGNTPDDAILMAKLFKAAGADLIDVSSGQTTPDAQPVYGRMYQTPFADRIRNEAGIATIAVGNIFEADHVNSIIAAGRADLCALARPHLADPAWTLHAAAQQGYREMPWPRQYLGGKEQLERNLARARQIAEKS